MIIYHQLTMKLIKNVRNYLSGKVLTVHHELIANVTDVIIDEAKAWQHRPLDSVYPILYLDAMVIKIREGNLSLMIFALFN